MVISFNMASLDTDHLAKRSLRIAGLIKSYRSIDLRRLADYRDSEPMVLRPRTPTVPLRGVDMAQWPLYNLRLSPPEAARYLVSSSKRLEVLACPR